MKINLNDLPPEGAIIEGDLPPEILEATAEDSVRCDGPIHCRLRALVVSDELLVDGTLQAPLQLRCRRCDCRFAGKLDDLAYHYDLSLVSAPEYVDLTDDIREAIILAFPSYPICDPACKGLCPQCGANLNETTCECKPPADNRWAALGGL